MGQARSSILHDERGQPLPRGCYQQDSKEESSVNFSLHAPGSSSAWLVLSLPPGHPGWDALDSQNSSEELLVPLSPSLNRTDGTWHVCVKAPFAARGALYMWLLDPQLDDDGRPVSSAPRILDPYALSLSSSNSSLWNFRGHTRYSPCATVPDSRACTEFNWQGVVSPGLCLKDLVIYEAHVRGFTRNRDSGISSWDANAGTFLGFIEKIPHLLQLGINCVELLPVFEFDETACPRTNPHTGQQLCNYWGYSTVAFFVPMQRFAARDQVSSSIVGFKTLVRECHRHGIEVILDVVFNHTAEGTWNEWNWHSLAAIDKRKYYILSNGQYANYTGCGNTVNANNPMCAEWICDCLRYWVHEMHVDGFRFDLASALTRGENGHILCDPPLIRKMLEDPCLQKVKLIAEPWDCSWPDGYLLGRFPSYGHHSFAEWNGMFRDTIRRFIKGDANMKGEFATRICGSSDLFKHRGLAPFHSINYVTAHDGFTLWDLVSYNGKHNGCNGEQSGDDHNDSWNCGVEGGTCDRRILHLRERQFRNLLVALLVSIGTPMITFGDEYGRTQQGCNNGWCQDELSWFSWTGLAKEQQRKFRFCSLMVALRKHYSHLFCRDRFLSGKDVWWRTDWDDPYNYVCFILHSHQNGRYVGLLVAFNAGCEVRYCDLPQHKKWYRLVDTNLAPPNDLCQDESAAIQITTDNYEMQPYSSIVLKTMEDLTDAFKYNGVDARYSAQQDLGQVASRLREVTGRNMSMEFMRDLSHRFSRQTTPQEVETALEDAASETDSLFCLAMHRSRSMFMSRASMSGSLLDVNLEPDVMDGTPVDQNESKKTDQEHKHEDGNDCAKQITDENDRNGKDTGGQTETRQKDQTRSMGSCRVEFHVRCAATKLGECLFVVGSIPELGSWEPAEAVQCKTTAKDFPQWTTESLMVLSSDKHIEFKLLIQREDKRGHQIWEHGMNRTLQLPVSMPSSDVLTVECSWNNLDGC